MRLLLVHADRFSYETGDPTSGAADAGDAATSGCREGCVVVFVTVEDADETAMDRAVAGARAEVADVTARLRTTSVVLYPCPHLSGAIATPGAATDALRSLADSLRDDHDVLRAPAGQQGTFELAAKGHPLATQSRTVVVDSEGPQRSCPDHRERTVVSPGGDREPAAETVGPEMGMLVEAESQAGAGTETGTWAGSGGGYPDAARESGLVACDESGTARPHLTPRGTFLGDALVESVRDGALSAGAVPVDTPGVIAPEATAHSGSRPGVLSVLGTAGLDRADLPVSVYQRAIETVGSGDRTRDSHGDLTRGARRLQSRTVPEVWTIAAGPERARTAFVERARFARQLAEQLGLDPCYRLQVTSGFRDRHGRWIERLAGALDGPVLVEERADEGRSAPAELAFVTLGSGGRQFHTATVSLDVGGAAGLGRDLDIGSDSDSDSDSGLGDATPSLVRCAPIGSVESAIAALVARAERREPPRLPAWLAPTQVRLVPLHPGEHRDRCDELAERLGAAGVRVDVDDRETTVGERLDQADADWVPYYAAVGGADLDSGALDVTVRSQRTEVALSVGELGDRARADTGGQPRKRRYLPRYLSEQLPRP